MKRLVLITIACLLVGVVVNTAVAWGCALWSPPTMLNGWNVGTPAVGAGSSRPRDYGTVRTYQEVESSSGVGFEYRAITTLRGVSGEGGREVLLETLELEAGWPVRTWRGTRAGANGPSDGWLWSPSWTERLHINFAFVGDERPLYRGLPLWPRIGPLIALSAPFAAWPAYLIIRRLRRTRRQQCPECGYDARGLSACPECGTARAASTVDPKTPV